MKNAEYQEKKRHGTPDFPIQYYRVKSRHPQYVMEPHWHKETEIIRVLSGDFRVFLNNEEYRLSAGDILLVNGGTIHRGEPKRCIYECLVFDLSMLRRQHNDAAQRFLAPLLNDTAEFAPPQYQGDRKVIDALFDTMKNQAPGYELLVYSLLFSLLYQLYRDEAVVPSVKSARTHRTETVAMLLDWIEKHFTEAITLEKLSEISGLSAKYLCRIFKEYTSKTVVRYINELRINHACHLMASGKNSTQAAFDSGFNDLSYFCKTFKAYTGVTPSVYKKEKL